MTRVPWYFRNDQLHSELNIETVAEIVKNLSTNYEKRLHAHCNSEALYLLEDPVVMCLKKKYFLNI